MKRLFLCARRVATHRCLLRGRLDCRDIIDACNDHDDRRGEHHRAKHYERGTTTTTAAITTTQAPGLL